MIFQNDQGTIGLPFCISDMGRFHFRDRRLEKADAMARWRERLGAPKG